MSEKPKSVYVVMKESGAVMTFGSLSGSNTTSEGPYLHILSVIATDMQSAGGNWDAPEKLFLNGKLVVESGLADLAWKFRNDEVGAREAASREVKNLHMPAWLPDGEQKPGYNPPGVDKWIVKKAVSQ